MKKIKDLVVIRGSYQQNNQTKHKYLRIGSLFTHEDGNHVILLDPTINLAAIPRKEGSDDVFVRLFDIDPDRGKSKPGNRFSSISDALSSAHKKAGLEPEDPAESELPF